MTASEVVSLIRDIALIAGGVTVTIVSVVLLRKTNRLLKRLEAYLHTVDTVGRGFGTAVGVATDVAAAVSSIKAVRASAAVGRGVFRLLRRRKSN